MKTERAERKGEKKEKKEKKRKGRWGQKCSVGCILEGKLMMSYRLRVFVCSRVLLSGRNQ